MIGIIDYAAGNILNVVRALEYLGYPAQVSSDPAFLEKTDLLILPGVGSFGQTMQSLNERGLTKLIRDQLEAKRPFLGICLGLQLLFSGSEESPNVPGLGIFSEKIKKFPNSPDLSVPQIGWNKIHINHPKFSDFNESFVYFVHSYFAPLLDHERTLATTNYGQDYTSAVIQDQLIATQFHPEKSGDIGLAFLRRALEYLGSSKP